MNGIKELKVDLANGNRKGNTHHGVLINSAPYQMCKSWQLYALFLTCVLGGLTKITNFILCVVKKHKIIHVMVFGTDPSKINI